MFVYISAILHFPRPEHPPSPALHSAQPIDSSQAQLLVRGEAYIYTPIRKHVKKQGTPPPPVLRVLYRSTYEHPPDSVEQSERTTNLPSSFTATAQNGRCKPFVTLILGYSSTRAHIDGGVGSIPHEVEQFFTAVTRYKTANINLGMASRRSLHS